MLPTPGNSSSLTPGRMSCYATAPGMSMEAMSACPVGSVLVCFLLIGMAGLGKSVHTSVYKGIRFSSF